ncbi:MAG: hypothetical protein KIG29_05910 [Oscillospiraceae bacterium]|nr:hypothetical protein [Oscillospiraceae bacterium]MDD5808557.1 hypothetical protein [Oscillospiraceae bacterium]
MYKIDKFGARQRRKKAGQKRKPAARFSRCPQKTNIQQQETNENSGKRGFSEKSKSGLE